MHCDQARGRERARQRVPGGRPVSPDADFATEVAALAELLAEVVQLAGQSAIFPGYWEALAEQAMEHHSMRAALLAAREAAS